MAGFGLPLQQILSQNRVTAGLLPDPSPTAVPNPVVSSRDFYLLAPFHRWPLSPLGGKKHPLFPPPAPAGDAAIPAIVNYLAGLPPFIKQGLQDAFDDYLEVGRKWMGSHSDM